ncbi:MAG: non-homologous end-joining DNA ligase [bacterium]|nr:non-homologous end-joining DNA ligase [bacterium]
MRKIKIGKYTVELTHEDKVLFPKEHITKRELINYYRRIASVMIPHIENRPLTMHRFVNGIDQEGFYQKDAADYFPLWIVRKPLKKKEDGVVRYVICNNAATLVYLANQLSITQHVWLSKINKLNYPDRMIFDLDPSPGVTFSTVRWVAKKLKELLEELAFKPFVMTTGSRGVHVVVPLKPVHTFDMVRDFARDVAYILAREYPQKITIEMRKAKRGKCVFLDTLRNAFGQTGVAPYSVRAKSGAPVATPIAWDELFKKGGITPQKYTIKNIFRRLGAQGDVWENIDSSACTLKQARKKLDALLG